MSSGFTPSTYVDPSGRRLEDYPRPSVATDVAVLTVTPEPQPRLAVLTVSGAPGAATGRRALPGTFLHPGEELMDAALRGLRDKLGLVGRRPVQLRVFDAPERDFRGWVLSVAHVDVLRFDAVAGLLDGEGTVTASPVDDLPPMAFDHGDIVRVAVEHVRSAHGERPDPFGLLGERMTLLQLQRLHEAVLGRPLVKDTFRRRMQALLLPVEERQEGVVGKPARLWTRLPGGSPRRLEA
jgi:ADP-ribose pyrophosphatase YjhB (NUDIX family)